jgi:hypothetical protein
VIGIKIYPEAHVRHVIQLIAVDDVFDVGALVTPAHEAQFGIPKVDVLFTVQLAHAPLTTP